MISQMIRCGSRKILWSLWGVASFSNAASIAYIHGDVGEDGSTPSIEEPYDQMLIDDAGSTGLTMFRDLVESEGHVISQYYDVETELTETLLEEFDVIVFGLHQKIWSNAEKTALDDWLNAGGGMFIYSDSASGGFHRVVGAQNSVGQTVTNNLITQYGMQVTVDQANGVKKTTVVTTPFDILTGGMILEGEGVSPVAVGDDSRVRILIPFEEGLRFTQNITINNPSYAALAISDVGDGHVAVMFDRQPMWNSGVGSNIQEEDNQEILRRMINFLAVRPVVEPPVELPVPDDNESSEATQITPILLLLDES